MLLSDFKLLCRNALFVRTTDISRLGISHRGPVSGLVGTRRKFQTKFIVTEGPKWETKDNLFEIFQRTAVVKDDQAGNVVLPLAPVRDAIVEVTCLQVN